MRAIAVLLSLLSSAIIASAQQADRDAKLKEIERKLEEATHQSDCSRRAVRRLYIAYTHLHADCEHTIERSSSAGARAG